MTRPSAPIFTAEEWITVRELGGAGVEPLANWVATETEGCAEDDDDRRAARMIAAMNDHLDRRDPRKIDALRVEWLRGIAHDLRSAYPNSVGPAQLEAYAKLLESYLPPEI
jgi:hypothetical protein